MGALRPIPSCLALPWCCGCPRREPGPHGMQAVSCAREVLQLPPRGLRPVTMGARTELQAPTPPVPWVASVLVQPAWPLHGWHYSPRQGAGGGSRGLRPCALLPVLATGLGLSCLRPPEQPQAPLGVSIPGTQLPGTWQRPSAARLGLRVRPGGLSLGVALQTAAAPPARSPAPAPPPRPPWRTTRASASPRSRPSAPRGARRG